MTTIAWDGRTLAADSLGVLGDSLKVVSHKLMCFPDGRLLGCCGRMSDKMLVCEWLLHGGEKPLLDDSFAAILVEPTGQAFRLEESLVFITMHEPFHACGSGRDFAIAAMALGKTACEAVALAMQFDPWTGGAVEWLTLKEESRGEYV